MTQSIGMLTTALTATQNIMRAVNQTQSSGSSDGAYAAYMEQQALDRQADARSDADEAWKQTQKELAEQRKEQQRRRAQSRAKLSQSGVEMNSGSLLDVQSGAAYEDELDSQELAQTGADRENEILRSGTAAANRFRASTLSKAGQYGPATELLKKGGSIYGS